VSARAGELAVHVGSFHDAERAERLLLRLTGAGFAAYAVRDIVDGEPWVRVYAGPYATQAEAAQARDRLTEGGVVAYARIIPVAQ
jgi:cell division protein FtsN